MNTDPLFERAHRALSGRYTVLREIGRGGMGTVFLATDRQLGRDVAIKVLPPQTREYLGAERFQREMHIAAHLSHPHIVPLYEAGEADGLLYYVMAYLPGETLDQRVRREGPLSVPEAVRLTSEIGEALQYAHEQGVIHRDVKPSNIMLFRGHALVLDFGIAKAMTADAAGGGDTLTATGVVVGSVEYMSPEQAGGEKRLDPRTDVYALAAVLYEMLSGEPPFSGSSLQAIVARVLTDPPRPVRTVRRDLPEHVERVLTAGLAKLPADRPATAQAFIDLLARPALPPPTPPWPTRRGLAVAGILAAAALGAVYAVVHWPQAEPRARPAGSRVPPAGMVLVPGEEFLVGGAGGRAARRVSLDSFYIDSTEVTVAAYATFARATSRSVPWTVVTDSAWPVTGVLWLEADAYCRWSDPLGRLPSEDEWEAAARGPTGRRYPWGDAWRQGLANANRSADTLTPVGAHPLGRSWVGAVDLVGNAWEWTSTADTGSREPARRVIKGGAFNSPPAAALNAYRSALPDERTALGNTGFRCARPVHR